jgi:hypothetical protein
MTRRAAAAAAIVFLAIAGGWTLFVMLPKWYGSQPPTTTETPAQPGAGAEPSAAERRIAATLYYISEDGMALVGVKRDVAFAEAAADQARRIVEAQLGAAAPPLASAVPTGTTLRALYLNEKGDAFVDLSGEVRTNHAGGALYELFTIYAIVDALTVNLPAVARVQILIDGKEMDTLAGHVDLRHPLQKNLKWVKEGSD